MSTSVKKAGMDLETIKTINKRIFRHFPDLKGIKPKIRKRNPPQPKRSPPGDGVPKGPTFLLTYQSNAKSEKGVVIPRWVRVVITQKGKILKITTSR